MGIDFATNCQSTAIEKALYMALHVAAALAHEFRADTARAGSASGTPC
jgi:hypothetical protein